MNLRSDSVVLVAPPAHLRAKATPEILAMANEVLAESGVSIRYGIVQPTRWRLLVDVETGHASLACLHCQATLALPGELAADFRSEPLALLRHGAPLPACGCGDAA